MSPSPSSSRHSRLVIACLSTLLLTLLATSCQDDEARIAELLDQGHAFTDQQQFPEAIIEFRSLLQLNPNHAEAHHLLANAYMQTQQLQEAIWEYGEAARLDPANLDARVSLGALFLVFQKFAEVEEQALAAIELAPEDAKGHALLGPALEGLDRADEAESAYLKTIELDPETGQYLAVLAAYYSRQGNRAAAEPPFVKYAEAFPSAESYTALGRFLAEESSRDAEAQRALERALELASGDRRSGAYGNLANLHTARGRLDQAQQVLREGIESLDDPEQKAETIYHLARLLGRVGDQEGVTALLESAAQVTPDDVKPHMLLARLRSSDGDIDGALEAINKALAAGTANSQPLLAKAEILIQDGFARQDDARIAEGTEIVNQALAAEPSNSNALFVKAKLALARENGAAAVEAASAALDSRPNWAQAHFVLGQALVMTDNTSGARAEVARAVELDPNLLDARRVLAGLHASLGEHEYAVEQGRILLSARPDDVDARLLVAQSLARLGRTDEALAEVPNSGNSAKVNFAQGRLLLAQGKIQQSRAALLQADEQSPHHPEILRLLLNIDAQLDKLDDSAARIEAALTANPDQGEFVRLSGTHALLKGNTAAAEQKFERAIELDPENLFAYQQLAQVQQNDGRLEKTLETYRRAIDKRPDSARLHHLRATLHEMTGNTAEAMSGYEKAIELDASMAQSKNNLAYLLADSGGDLDRALNLAQEAKAMMPESPSTADTLGWVLYQRGIPSAAVGYLLEALAGMDSDSPDIGMVRHHLALAYEANKQPGLAIDSLELSLTELEQQQKKTRAAGGTPEDPQWSGPVREMLQRLKSAS